MGPRERETDAGQASSVSKIGRSRSRDAQTIQNWTHTGGVPGNKSQTQGFSCAAAWQVQRQPEPAAECLLIDSLSC